MVRNGMCFSPTGLLEPESEVCGPASGQTQGRFSFHLLFRCSAYTRSPYTPQVTSNTSQETTFLTLTHTHTTTANLGRRLTITLFHLAPAAHCSRGRRILRTPRSRCMRRPRMCRASKIRTESRQASATRKGLQFPRELQGAGVRDRRECALLELLPRETVAQVRA